MRNRELATDYVRRAGIRLSFVAGLFQAESWPDVVREAQEVVELALKGLLRRYGVEAPRLHDVSTILLESGERFPEPLRGRLGELAEVSRELRRDRELAFYGAEDLTPSAFYTREDAAEALRQARFVVETVSPFATD